jgi:nucleotide-binding universal stress UspA family protein
MYKRILAALDGSRSSRLALDEALKIAAASDATVFAVSVVEHAGRLTDINLGPVYNPETESAISETAAVALEEAAELFKLRRVHGTTRAIEVYGEEIAPALKRAAAECDADLIVMGTAGRRGMERILLGSVAESLLRSSDRPILLVRHDPDGKA